MWLVYISKGSGVDRDVGVNLCSRFFLTNSSMTLNGMEWGQDDSMEWGRDDSMEWGQDDWMEWGQDDWMEWGQVVRR